MFHPALHTPPPTLNRLVHTEGFTQQPVPLVANGVRGETWCTRPGTEA
jgi:hypothetical protein